MTSYGSDPTIDLNRRKARNRPDRLLYNAALATIIHQVVGRQGLAKFFRAI